MVVVLMCGGGTLGGMTTLVATTMDLSSEVFFENLFFMPTDINNQH
jgi:hypothetical protein